MDARSTSDASSIADVALVRGLLIAAARAGEAISYSGFLNLLGLRFSRPKMRALCRTLDRIDQDGAAAGEPGLAVLVVRESDGLPGQGWWQGWRSAGRAWEHDWTGPAARAHVEEEQEKAFRHWQERSGRRLVRPSARRACMADETPEDIYKHFHEAVNMTPAAIEKWLDTPESKEVGWKGADGKGSGESVGHKEGQRIVEILRTKKGELTDDDCAHMRKVTGYVRRHLAQGGPADDTEHSPWRYSLMNWGHDPLKT